MAHRSIYTYSDVLSLISVERFFTRPQCKAAHMDDPYADRMKRLEQAVLVGPEKLASSSHFLFLQFIDTLLSPHTHSFVPH